jgi:hypothetical protein
MQAHERGMEQPTDPFERLQRRADAMSRLSAGLKRLADAGTPLYQSLNEAQKRRFMLLAIRCDRIGWVEEVIGMTTMRCADDEWVTPDAIPMVVAAE